MREKKTCILNCSPKSKKKKNGNKKWWLRNTLSKVGNTNFGMSNFTANKNV